MARVLQSYFPHDSNARNDRKMLRLRRIFGLEGYGIYWAIIEILREQPDFKYPLDDISELEFELRISKEKILGVITKFGLFEVDEEKKFFSVSLIARLQPYLKKSENARLAANKRWENALKLKKSNTKADANASTNASANRREKKRIKKNKGETLSHPLQKIIREKYPRVSKLPEQLSVEEAEKLKQKFSKVELKEIFDAMENYAPLVQKNVSVYLTFVNWARRRQQGEPSNNFVPLSQRKI